MYNYIYNENNDKISIHSKKGLKLLKSYINNLHGGAINSKVPKYVTELNVLLPKINKLLTYNDETGKLNEYWMKIMNKFGLKKKDVLHLINKGRYMWVIEPQDYNKITKLNKKSECIEDDYFELNDPYYKMNTTLTTGDGPGSGDAWYRAKPKLVNLLKTFLKKYS